MNNLDCNISYQITRLVENNKMTYLEATLYYYNAKSEIDDLNKFVENLDKSIIKEIEKEAYEEGKLKSISTENIDNFFQVV